jgi:hypothetical protein
MEELIEINENNGAYIFKNRDNIKNTDDLDLLLYMKLTDEELKRALPISYNPNLINSNYLAAIFHNGYDHLAQYSFETIKRIISEENMKSIIDNDYITIQSYFNKLSYETYIHYKEFANKQLTHKI